MFHGAHPIIFKHAKRLRSDMTQAETILWGSLRRRQINNLRFKRQHPIANFIADFYCHQTKLIIEVDGEIHNSPENILSDEQRTDELESLGVKVMRFTNSQVINETQEVVKAITLATKKIK
jgi:cyclase